jgi:membrane fusion protein (multidrug efflux system)
LKAAIAKTEIKAPFSGTIGLKEVSEGSFVSPGTKISYLVNSSPIRIECSIPEKYTSLVKKNMKIQFHVYGNEQSFEAKISAINPMIDPISRTTKIIALYANKKEECKPGAFADIEIPLSVEEKAIMIPNEAIVPDIRGLRVFLLKQGKAKPKPIEAGMRTASSLEIIKGLNIGDTVLVAGASLMKPGSKVKAKPMYMK